MPFTAAATAALAAYSKQVDYLLELRTGFTQSADWCAYPFQSFTLTHDAGTGGELAPAELRAKLCNDALDFSRETDPACRTQLFAEARLSASVAGETEVLFLGRVYRVEPEDFSFTLYAHDPLALTHEAECELALEPAATDELPVRELFLLADGAFGSVFGFACTGPGDLAFNTNHPVGLRRRAWAPGDVRLWYDAAATLEVPPLHYQVNLSSGAASLLEDTTGQRYFATGVACYIEGSLDWADAVSAALSYPAAQGGLGVAPAQLDCPPTGLDLAAPLYYRGSVGGLLREILRNQQQNLRLWFNSRTGCFTLRVVKQREPGAEDWTLLAAQSVAQPRELRDVYSRVVVSGACERPRSALTEAGVVVTPLADGDWFGWQGVSSGWPLAPGDALRLLYDGDYNLGCGVHNLAASAGGGSDRYDSWYAFALIDLGAAQRISRVRVGLPSSRNMNAAAGHQGAFWPGLQVLGSTDGAHFRLLSPKLHGRFAPLTQLDISGADITLPQARYVKLLLGAYKYGHAGGHDPQLALGEFELYVNEDYHVVKEIDPAAAPASYYSYTADYDGGGAAEAWPRNHPALWARLGGRHRTLFTDRRGELNEYLAHDYALDLLREGVRLFQQAVYRAVCDPRVRLYDTVAVPDELNGDVAGILVERIVLSPEGTEISGTNYRAEEL